MASPSFRRANLFYLAIPIAVVAGWLAISSLHTQAAVGATASATGTRQPVLVELFTSEGCSSCPPADTLLARLDAEQFVPNAQAIVLSEHVTYWNHLGWSDPFSTQPMTERQQQYATRFGLDDVYTPQAVVDGASELVGSDSEALRRAVTHAATIPKPELGIENAKWTGDMVHFAVRSTATSHGRLMAAIAADATQSTVTRGENAGRTLRHVAVVLVLEEMGVDAADGRPLRLELPAARLGRQIGEGTSLRLVVFLTDERTGRVLGVAEREITR